jgi:hypothetical protein
MLGMLAYWVDMQGNEDECRRLAQRGLDAAPSLDDPITAMCWFAFAGATAAIAPGSPVAVAAFQHEAAAVANLSDLDHDWFALVNLTDASLHSDPTVTPALRQQVRDLAARVQSPRLTTYAHQIDGHCCLSVSPPDFAGASAAYQRMTDVAKGQQFQAIALRCLAMSTTGLGAPDAVARCHAALDALFELRYWQKIWQILESATLALARAGRTERAAVILGHLDAHSPGLGLEHILHFRDLARELVDADGDHSVAKHRGEQMSAEELVAAALEYCSTPPADHRASL